MRDSSIRFGLDARSLDRLQALAEQRHQSLALLLRSLVYDVIYQTALKEAGTDEQSTHR